MRLVHTIIFDGDHEKDFIKGLGLVFAVPMREQVHNRHVRFSGEGDGLLVRAGAARSPAGGRSPGASYARPTRGQAHRPTRRPSTPPGRSCSPTGRCGIDFKLVADHRRRLHHLRSAPTRRAAGWMRSAGGRRQRPRLRGRRLAAASPSASRISGSRIPPRSKCATPPQPRRSCASGSGPPKRPPWTCATTTPARTISIPATKTCSPASARRTASRAPAS